MLTDLIEKIMGLFNGQDDPNAKNKRLIKEIKKGLKKNSKYYNVKKDEVTVVMAQFFYDLYKFVIPYSEMLSNIEESKEFKKMIVEFYMSDSQKAAVEKLTRENVIKRLTASKNVKISASKIQKEIIALVSSFSSDLTVQINSTFSMMLIFKELACFNYYFLLKKFDSRLPAGDFVYKPAFSDINGTYVSEDLKDFLEVLKILDNNQDWKTIFSILAGYRETIKVDMKTWNRLLKSINETKNSNVFLNIVKVADEDPFYEVKSHFSDFSIVEDYIKVIREDAESSLKEVLRQKREQAKDKYVAMIFGDPASAQRNKYYTKHANITYEKKNLEGYKYVDPMNYIRAYYLDYFKTEAKKVIEILLIQGQWSTHVASQDFSEAFHKIQEFLPKSIDLDNSLSDDENTGKRIKSMLRKAGKDAIALNALDSEISTVNGQAKIIVEGSLAQMIAIGNIIKSILEEFKSGKVEIIINWKDIQDLEETPLEELMLNTYKKMFYMVQLIQHTIKDL